MCVPVLLAGDGEFGRVPCCPSRVLEPRMRGTDGLKSLSPRFTIRRDRERNKELERRSATEGNVIIEIEKKPRYKKEPCCFKVEMIPKIGSTKRRLLCQHRLVDERETGIDFCWCAQAENGVKATQKHSHPCAE